MVKQASILVIDDDPNNFDVIEALLSHELYQLHFTSSGQRALELLDSFQPDVILLDVMMPDLDGIEVCRRIKAMPQWQAVPIIIVTALNTKEDLANCLNAGADDYISKPVNGIELRARVTSMLRIKQQYDNVQTLMQLRDDMVNMIVHDLRNPLASILLATDILKRFGSLPTPQHNKVEQIAIAGHQLQAMIDSLLLTAKLESGKLTLNCTEVDLCAICCSALSDFEAIAAQKGLTLVGELPDPGSSITVDVPIFRRVLDNLLSNAIKFSPRNSSVILRAGYTEKGDVTLQVIDFGSGVNEALRQSIFEKFEVGTLVEHIPQIGLGLAFCKMAIEAHHGSIAIADNNPQGAVFTINLQSA
ncbi:MAG TPA: response regulator [Crinalium sp.]|jgi:signal transduction histidine kinase